MRTNNRGVVSAGLGGVKVAVAQRLRYLTESMRQSAGILIGALALAALAGCASRTPSGELRGEPTALPESLPGMSIPLDVREFDVVVGDDGYRGVFLKLSRLPTGVTHSAQSDPTRIVVTIAGATGSEAAPETFPANDEVVTKFMVARRLGYVQVVLDLSTEEVPEYEVLPMADWVLVRIKPGNTKRPWAHRAS